MKRARQKQASRETDLKRELGPDRELDVMDAMEGEGPALVLRLEGTDLDLYLGDKLIATRVAKSWTPLAPGVVVEDEYDSAGNMTFAVTISGESVH